MSAIPTIRIQIVGFSVVNINQKWLIRVHKKTFQIKSSKKTLRRINCSIQMARPDTKLYKNKPKFK